MPYKVYCLLCHRYHRSGTSIIKEHRDSLSDRSIDIESTPAKTKAGQRRRALSQLHRLYKTSPEFRETVDKVVESRLQDIHTQAIRELGGTEVVLRNS